LQDEHYGTTACNDANSCPTLRAGWCFSYGPLIGAVLKNVLAAWAQRWCTRYGRSSTNLLAVLR